MISFSSRISATLLLMAEVARDFAFVSAKPFIMGFTRISRKMKRDMIRRMGIIRNFGKRLFLQCGFTVMESTPVI